MSIDKEAESQIFVVMQVFGLFVYKSYSFLHKTLIIVPPSEDKNKFYSNILPINIVIEIISNSKLNRPFSLFFIPSKKQEVKKCKIQK